VEAEKFEVFRIEVCRFILDMMLRSDISQAMVQAIII
jgi:hypothetical protein